MIQYESDNVCSVVTICVCNHSTISLLRNSWYNPPNSTFASAQTAFQCPSWVQTMVCRLTAIIWTIAGILLIGSPGIYFVEIVIKTLHFRSRKYIWKCFENGGLFVQVSMCYSVYSNSSRSAPSRRDVHMSQEVKWRWIRSCHWWIMK